MMATPESVRIAAEKAKAHEEKFQERVKLFLMQSPFPTHKDIHEHRKLYDMLIEKILRMEENIEHLQRIEQRSRPLG